jgi:hypothetical protein
MHVIVVIDGAFLPGVFRSSSGYFLHYFAGRLIFPEARENSGLANAAASCKAGKFKIGHQLRLVLSKPPPACPAHSRFLFLS